MTLKTFFVFAALNLAMAIAPVAARADGDTTAIETLPVQDGGRVKPFDSFARESMQLIYGRQTYESSGGLKRPAREVVMTWMLAPQFWENENIVQITHQGLKDALKIDKDRKYFSPNELLKSERLPLALQDLASHREAKEKLGPYYQAAQQLESAIGLFHAIRNGTAVRVLPPPASEVNPDKPGSDKWKSVSELDGEARDKFMAVARAFIRSLPQGQAVAPADAQEAGPTLAQAVSDFVAYGRKINPGAYADQRAIEIEVHYNHLHPFMWAWIFYLVSALVAAIAWQRQSRIAYACAWVAAAFAFGMHTYGFGLRIHLTGRPPVSNMYESVVWVSWGAVLFSLIFEFLKRRRYSMIAGSLVGVICLVVADMAPAILDESLRPLEPVLRSNYWLTIHVLTITLSYSAFFLGWGLAMLGMGFILRGDSEKDERVRDIVQSLYRALQVGTVLLAAGTILGGVWADYSWGRFWGWDPKETWAFIALLGYVAILHGRLAGWLRGFGLLASSIVAFSLVIMAWYGVNYVLGAGLHTYGFGAGGIQYVAGFVILNLIYVAYVAFVRSSRNRAAGVHSA